MKKSRLRYFFMMAITAASTHTFAQLTLSGKVRDVLDEPLIGVNILIKNTLLGTTTNLDGSFSMQVPQDNSTGVLVFSSIGYISQEIQINNQNVFTIVLLEDTKLLGEVVVTGYQTEERKKIFQAKCLRP